MLRCAAILLYLRFDSWWQVSYDSSYPIRTSYKAWSVPKDCVWSSNLWNLRNENKFLVQRILSVKSSVDVSSLEKDYWRRGDPADQILLLGNFGTFDFSIFLHSLGCFQCAWKFKFEVDPHKSISSWATTPYSTATFVLLIFIYANVP